MKSKTRNIVAMLMAVLLTACTPAEALAVNKPASESERNTRDVKWIQMDSKSDQIYYTGTWVDETSGGLIGGDSKQTNVPGAAAEFTFRGTGFRWIGQKDTNYGEAKIYMDGDLLKQVSVSSKSGNPLQANCYTVMGLPEGDHTIKIECVGPQVQYQNFIELDALQYTEDTERVQPDCILAEPESVTLKEGRSTALSVQTQYEAEGADVYNAQVQASSRDSNVAQIDESLHITAGQAGKTEIMLSCGESLTKEIPVEVIGKVKLRMTIDQKHPLIIHHMARELNEDNEKIPGPIQGGHDIVTFWNQLPENQKPYSAVVIHPGYYLNVDYSGHMEFLEEQIKLANDNHIPFFVMTGNSFTTNYLSNAKMEEYYQKYEYCMGSAYSELHSAGGKRQSLSNEMADKIELAAKYGGHVWIADMNDEGDSLETLMSYEHLYKALTENSENVIIMSKTTSAWSTSVSYNSFESVTYGAWLSGLCGNYGSLIDSWMWFIENYWKLYEEPDGTIGNHGPEECRGAFAFPELLYPMRMIQEAMNGATVFSFEHPFYSTGIRNKIGPVYEHAISKAIDYMLEERIPDKEEMLDKTKIAYDSSDGSLSGFASSNSWDIIGTLYGDSGRAGTEKTFLTQTTGRYGIVPSIIPKASAQFRSENPDILMLSKNDIEGKYGSQQVLKNLFDKYYPKTYEGDGFASKLDNTWFTYNSKWQKKGTQSVKLNLDDKGSCATISYDNFTYMLLKKEENSYEVKLNNFLVDKDDIWEGYIALGENATEHWDSDHNDLWPKYLLDCYMPDESRRDEIFRKTEIILNNQEEAPVVKVVEGMYDSGNQHNQFKDPVVVYTPEKKEAIITIESNGWVNFTIAVKGNEVDKSELKSLLEKAAVFEQASFTAETYKALQEAIKASQVVLQSEHATQEEVDKQAELLKQAISGLKPAQQGNPGDDPIIENPGDSDSQEQLILEKSRFRNKKVIAAGRAEGHKNIRLTWKRVEDADGYEILLYNGKTYTGIKTVYNNETVSYRYTKTVLGKKYRLAVKAYKMFDGQKVYSGYRATSQKAVPETPSVKAKASKGKITLRWKKISGVSGYIVMKKKGTSFRKVSELKKNKGLFKETGISRNKQVKYKVKAYCKKGKKKIYSAYSKIIIVKAK